jgi:hypothetical protein
MGKYWFYVGKNDKKRSIIGVLSNKKIHPPRAVAEICLNTSSVYKSYTKKKSEFICGRWYLLTGDDLKNAFSRSTIQFILLYNSPFL